MIMQISRASGTFGQRLRNISLNPTPNVTVQHETSNKMSLITCSSL